MSNSLKHCQLTSQEYGLDFPASSELFRKQINEQYWAKDPSESALKLLQNPNIPHLPPRFSRTGEMRNERRRQDVVETMKASIHPEWISQKSVDVSLQQSKQSAEDSARKQCSDEEKITRDIDNQNKQHCCNVAEASKSQLCTNEYNRDELMNTTKSATIGNIDNTIQTLASDFKHSSKDSKKLDTERANTKVNQSRRCKNTSRRANRSNQTSKNTHQHNAKTLFELARLKKVHESTLVFTPRNNAGVKMNDIKLNSAIRGHVNPQDLQPLYSSFNERNIFRPRVQTITSKHRPKAAKITRTKLYQTRKEIRETTPSTYAHQLMCMNDETLRPFTAPQQNAKVTKLVAQDSLMKTLINNSKDTDDMYTHNINKPYQLSAIRCSGFPISVLNNKIQQ